MPVISIFLWCLSIATFLILGSLFLLVSLLIPPARLHGLGRLACRLVLLAAGQRLQLSGAFPSAKDGPHIYMFNHTSLLDNLVVISALPELTSAIGKKEQFKIPIWGSILRRWGAVPIDRSCLSQAIESLNAVGRLFDDGRSLLIAPEGTRSTTGELLPFKKGPFHLAVAHQVSVVPMVITGAYESKHRGTWQLRPGLIKISIRPAVHHVPNTPETHMEFLNRVRQAFEDGLAGT